MTNNLNDSEDIIQEAFIHSFKKLDQLKDPSNYKAWLKRIVLNLTLKKIKTKRSFELMDSIESKDIQDDTENGKWYEAIPFNIIQDEIQNLPNGCREILSLYLLDNYKHKEISDLLNISVSTSKSQYSYGLKKLRRNLIKYKNE